MKERLVRWQAHRPLGAASVAFGLAAALMYALLALSGVAERPWLADKANVLGDLATDYRALEPTAGTPGQLILFEDRSLDLIIAARHGRVPAALPGDQIAAVLDRARSYRVPLVAFDLDIIPQRPADEEARLLDSLARWAADRSAGALLLVRRWPCGAMTSACRPVRSPYDAVVAGARNIAWVSALVDLDAKGNVRWAKWRQHPRIPDPNIAVVAGLLLERAGHFPLTERSARSAALLAQMKRCPHTLPGGISCIRAPSWIGWQERILIPYERGIPDDRQLARYEGNGLDLTVRPASEFLSVPWRGDLRGTALFVGATHRLSDDRLLTPIGDRQGIAIVAGAATHWAAHGVAPPPSRLAGMLIAFCWGAATGSGIVFARRIGAVTRRWGRPWAWLADPAVTIPTVVFVVNVAAFLLLTILPTARVDWAALAVSQLLFAILATLNSLHGLMRKEPP